MDDRDNATPSAPVSPLQLYGIRYIEFLRQLHVHLAPDSYFEIGADLGESLACAECDTIVVDPAFRVQGNAAGGRRQTFFFQMTSDAFFRSNDVRNYFPKGIDLAFLDGMHRIEYLLRDFINTEAASHNRSLILLHDCLPLNSRMARRNFTLGDTDEGELAHSWTGDVWKIIPILKEYRPDLRVHVLDCPPTGLVAVSRLDPSSTALSGAYHEILDKFGDCSLDSYGLQRLWGEHRLVDSRSLVDLPEKLTALFSVI